MVGIKQSLEMNTSIFYLLDTKNGTVYNHIENPENTYKKRLADVWNRNPHIHAFSKP